MKGKTTQNSELTQILINKYGIDIDVRPAKEKKKDILDLFQNSNNLRSKEELKEITEKLHDACIKGDVDLIKIYLSETIENDSKSLKFKIDRTNQTASLFKVSDNIEELVIPRTVRHESTDFLITSISGFCQNIKTVKFVEDSAVETFYRNAISSLKAEEIQFPSSLKELKEGWCHFAKIKKFGISPLNDHFVFKDGKYLLGKSEENNDEFDVLLYARCDIEEFSLQQNIKVISPFALSNCYKLAKVEIPQNSNLQVIGEKAFSSTDIKEIFIPPKVTKICDKAFSFCENLAKVEIPENSNLQTIGNSAFESSKVEEIYFPASLKELKAGWCSFANFKKIEISPLNNHFVLKDGKYLLGKSDENNDEFDVFLYAYRDIEEISIPSNIKIISPLAFAECKRLKKVEIPQNSNLQIIDRNSFFMTNIKSIFIPPKVTKICGCAFTHCTNLTRVEIPQNSDLQVIEDHAFMRTNIKRIFIPPKVSKICVRAFAHCTNLTRVEIPQNSELQTIEENAFIETNIKRIFIPPKLSKICTHAFAHCKNLTRVEIPQNTELQAIEDHAFIETNIKEIFIPPKLSKICTHAFAYCKNLTRVEIPQNSELQAIEEKAFIETNIKGFYIPPKVSTISEEAFNGCSNLQIIEISEESELESCSFRRYGVSNNLIIMCPSKTIAQKIHRL